MCLVPSTHSSSPACMTPGGWAAPPRARPRRQLPRHAPKRQDCPGRQCVQFGDEDGWVGRCVQKGWAGKGRRKNAGGAILVQQSFYRGGGGVAHSMPWLRPTSPASRQQPPQGPPHPNPLPKQHTCGTGSPARACTASKSAPAQSSGASSGPKRAATSPVRIRRSTYLQNSKLLCCIQLFRSVRLLLPFPFLFRPRQAPSLHWLLREVGGVRPRLDKSASRLSAPTFCSIQLVMQALTHAWLGLRCAAAAPARCVPGRRSVQGGRKRLRSCRVALHWVCV